MPEYASEGKIKYSIYQRDGNLKPAAVESLQNQRKIGWIGF